MAVADLLRRAPDQDSGPAHIGLAHSGLARTLRPIGDWPAFLATLRDNGFPVSPDREARVATLLWRLADAGIGLQRWEDAAGYLAPILCVSADDRDRFGSLLKRHYERHAVATGTVPPGHIPDAKAPAIPTWRDRTFFLIFGFAALLIVAAVVAWTMIGGGGGGSSANTGPQSPGPSGSSAAELIVLAQDLFVRSLVAAPALFLLAIILAWRQDKRAALIRKSDRVATEENYRIPSDRSGLFRDAVSRSALLLLKRAVLVVSDRIDVARSLKATVAANGWPSLHYRQRRTNVELVLLVDRGTSRDHLGYLADVLVDRLQAAQAFVTRYDYRFHPARVRLASGRAEGPPAQDLTRVAHRHTDHRLFLVTDGQGLFLPGTFRLDPALTREFGRFGQVVVLTPTPRDAWGERERALAAWGAIVVPATIPGLDVAATLVGSDADEVRKRADREIPHGFDPFLEQLERDFHRLSSDTPPRAEEIAEITLQLSVWMGSRQNYRVLAAVAAFPWIDPGLTLAFGAAVLGRPVDPALFARLARLPWMRSARMPEWLSIALINRLREDEQADLANRMTAVLRRGRSRASGFPMSPDECAALPLAQAADARQVLATADPAAFAGLQERVFISFLKGERLDPTNPRKLAATEEMTRGIGAEFDLWQKILAASALVVAACLFVFTNQLAALLQWIESDIGPRLTFLPGEPAAWYWRCASVVAMLAALTPWAISAWDVPEAVEDERLLKWVAEASDRIPVLRAARALVPLSVLHHAIWLFWPVAGVVCALAGVGDGSTSARLTAVASLSVLAWLLFTRLTVAGASTALRLGYDEVQVCDPENRCTSKPGGLAEYPLGRAIAKNGWLRASFAVLVCLALPFAVFVIFGVEWTEVFIQFDFRIEATFLVIATLVGWTLTLLLVRRLVIGQWRLPDRSWGRPITPLGDLLFATSASLLAYATLWLLAGNPVPSYFIFPWLGLCVCMMVASIRLVALRARVVAPNFGWFLGGIGLGIALQVPTSYISSDNIYFYWNGNLHGGMPGAITVSIHSLIFILSVVGVSTTALLYRSRRQSIDPDRLWRIRFWALAVGGACLVAAVPSFVFALLSFWPADVNARRLIAIGMIGQSLLVLYPIWRYVSPAAIDIELLKTEGRLPKPVAQPSTRAWWDTPRLALPLVAVCGLTFDLPLIGRWSYVEPFAIPVAVFFIARHGSAAIMPVLLGTLPFWLSLKVEPIGTTGGVWPAIAILFWCRFAGHAEFRARLLQREWLSWIDIALLSVLLLPTVSLILPVFEGWGLISSCKEQAEGCVPTAGLLVSPVHLFISPPSMLLTCCIVLAASRVPVRRTVLALTLLLALAAAAWFVPVLSLEYGGILFGTGANLVTIAVALLCLVLINDYRAPAVTQQPERTLEDATQTAVKSLLLSRDNMIASATLAYAVLSISAFREWKLPGVPVFALAAIGFCVGIGIPRAGPGERILLPVLLKIGVIATLATILTLLVASGIVPGLSSVAAPSTGGVFADLRIGPLAWQFVVWAGFVVVGHMVRREPQAVLQPARDAPEPTIIPSVEAEWLARVRDGLRDRIQSAQRNGRIGQDERGRMSRELDTLESNIGRALESNSDRPDELAILYETRNSIASLRRDLEGIPAGLEMPARQAEADQPSDASASQDPFNWFWLLHESLQVRFQAAQRAGRIGDDERSELVGGMNRLKIQIDTALNVTQPEDTRRRLQDVQASILDLRKELDRIPSSTEPEPTEPRKPAK
jgi:hypothetical protein